MAGCPSMAIQPWVQHPSGPTALPTGCSIRHGRGVPGAGLRGEQRLCHAVRGRQQLFLWVCRSNAGRALCSKQC